MARHARYRGVERTDGRAGGRGQSDAGSPGAGSAHERKGGPGQSQSKRKCNVDAKHGARCHAEQYLPANQHQFVSLDANRNHQRGDIVSRYQTNHRRQLLLRSNRREQQRRRKRNIPAGSMRKCKINVIGTAIAIAWTWIGQAGPLREFCSLLRRVGPRSDTRFCRT